MADVKISQLPAATLPVVGTEILPIVQSGVTSRVTIDNLTVGRAVSMTSVTVAAGAVGTPSITTSGDTNTGIFFPAADTIAFVEGGAEAMRIDSSGNVGIGINAPSFKLDVRSGASGATVGFGSTNSTAYSATGYNGATARLFLAGGTASGAANGIQFSQGGSAELFFGQVQEAGGATAFVFQGYNGTAYAERLRLDSSGNLGLGVTPSAWGGAYKAFEFGSGGSALFSGTSTAAQTYLTANAYFNGTNWIYKNTAIASYYEQTGGKHVWYNAPSGTAGNAITFTQAMTLDASGNLLVGTASPGIANTNSISIQPTRDTNGDIIINHATGAANGQNYLIFSYGGSLIGNITQNGTTGVLYNVTSDYRLKNNPQALTGAKDFIMSLQPKKWQWWDGSGEGVGFIAHEFMEVAKYSGTGAKNAVETVEIKDEQGQVTGTEQRPVMQSIQTSSSEVMANLVSFIQEQQALITSLTTRLTALENK